MCVWLVGPAVHGCFLACVSVCMCMADMQLLGTLTMHPTFSIQQGEKPTCYNLAQRLTQSDPRYNGSRVMMTQYKSAALKLPVA